MYQRHTTQRYNFVVKMIQESTFEDARLLDSFFAEDPENKKSFLHLLRKASICCDQSNAQIDYHTGYRILIDAVSDYLLAYSTSSAIKRRLYERLVAWCEHMGKQYQIENYNTYLNDIPEEVATDIVVELVKELHNQDGVTKEELAEKYHKSKKSFQVFLGQLGDFEHPEPLRIGGQAVHVAITTSESNRKLGKRRYHTENTLSPLVFQMNILQVETLLKSLQLNYDSGNNIPLDIAIDIWGQLSDYAKKRIVDVFSPHDPELAEFLEIVDSESQSDNYRFMTESEMMRQGRMSRSECLLNAEKGGMICNISLFNPPRTLKNQNVFRDHKKKCYFAVPADDPTAEGLYFTEEELFDIWEA